MVKKMNTMERPAMGWEWEDVHPATLLIVGSLAQNLYDKVPLPRTAYFDNARAILGLPDNRAVERFISTTGTREYDEVLVKGLRHLPEEELKATLNQMVGLSLKPSPSVLNMPDILIQEFQQVPKEKPGDEETGTSEIATGIPTESDPIGRIVSDLDMLTGLAALNLRQLSREAA